MLIRRVLTICDPAGGFEDFRGFQREPGLMWSPWMAQVFHIQRNDIVDQNITLGEIVAMWDSVKD